MSADTYPHPSISGPTGKFDHIGQVEYVQQTLPGDFNVLVRGTGTANFFLNLSINEGHLTPLTARFLDVGLPVYSQIKPPQASERLNGFTCQLANNRLFLVAPPTA